MELHFSTKQLRDLPVYTKSGTHLGKIVDVVIDAQAHRVVQYVVGNSDLLHSLIDHAEFLIAPTQVITLTKKKMVVEDTTTPVRAPSEASASI